VNATSNFFCSGQKKKQHHSEYICIAKKASTTERFDVPEEAEGRGKLGVSWSQGDLFGLCNEHKNTCIQISVDVEKLLISLEL
jgi:hypothetical protein